jgi:hypothetical protein
MKLPKKFAAAVAVAGTALLSLSTPAYAVTEVDCAAGPHVFQFELASGETRCFHEAGTMPVELRDPIRVTRGNGLAVLTYLDGQGIEQEFLVRADSQTYTRADGTLPEMQVITRLRLLVPPVRPSS